jgi:elongator complex protein 3
MARTSDDMKAWRRLRQCDDLAPYHDAALALLTEIRALERFDDRRLSALLRRHPRDDRRIFSKNLLVRLYRELVAAGRMEQDAELERRLRMKPTRSLSGVTTVTVLTRPHPCPGDCLFCPSEPGMPKSYLPDEPGAQRAAQHDFDPFAQVRSRLTALDTNGHPTDKIELLVLGGTWSSYPHDYQQWFVRRCLEALNDGGGGKPVTPGAAESTPDAAKSTPGAIEVTPDAALAAAQRSNETAPHRQVGLVVELRPDEVTPAEIRHLRRLGVTKLQMGAQSLDDRVLELNRRGHDVETTRHAMTLARAAGLKLVLHWMPNLLGATPDADRSDFARLWDDPALRPDELKIYPCSLLASADLHAVWQRGDYQPYDDATLIELVADAKARVEPYCRINRVVRDIPTPNIVAGCRLSNLRQAAQAHLAASERRCRCIRCREVRGEPVELGALRLDDQVYATRASEEHFLSFVTSGDQLAGYLRLSLPDLAATAALELGIAELSDAAIVREVHVYGQAVTIGRSGESEAQHRGLGTQLLAAAEQLAAQRGFRRMAVIAAVGTRRYYAGRGYELDGTYVLKSLC